MINNDTSISDTNFIGKYYSIDLTDTYVIGPRIISTVDNMDQNPFMVENHFIKNRRMAIRLMLVGFVKYVLILFGCNEFWEKKNIDRDYTSGLSTKKIKSDNHDFMLYGAAFILTKEFNNRFDKIPDTTFMYEEETILYMVLQKLELQFQYNPDLVIYHKEQSSTEKVYSNKRQRLVFGYKEDFKSRVDVFKISIHLNDKKYLSKLLQRR